MRLMFGDQRVLSTNIAVILSDAICVELMKMPETKQSGQQASSAEKVRAEERVSPWPLK